MKDVMTEKLKELFQQLSIKVVKPSDFEITNLKIEGKSTFVGKERINATISCKLLDHETRFEVSYVYDFIPEVYSTDMYIDTAYLVQDYKIVDNTGYETQSVAKYKIGVFNNTITFIFLNLVYSYMITHDLSYRDFLELAIE